MALLRVVHASQLPDPGELARKLQAGEAIATAPASSPSAPAQAAVPVEAPLLALPETFEALVKRVEEAAPLIGQQLHDFAGLVDYAPPRLALRPVKPLPGEFARDLATALKRITEQAWTVELSDAPSAPSLLQQQQAARQAAEDEILNSPMVVAVRSAFPDAELIKDTRS
jgi:DNA polymerase III subunit gamma/tau